MIQCNACGASHPPNTLFCDECGNRLGGANPQAHVPAGENGVRITLLSPSDQTRQFECVLIQELTVGRQDATADTRPDIDLNQLNGADRGVSRRHARFVRGQGRVLLEDLNSLNGTFVSGRRLTASVPHEVRSGDELQFGKVTLRLQIDPA
ncbi:MAG: FHA domain-containing protein [Chloroflexi bacterium]|nr:FHA domain-containing protein [Chloroflexota bacterium]